MIAGAQRADEAVNSRHSGRESVPARAALEHGQCLFEAGARGIASARVVPAFVCADAGEFECGSEVDGDVDGACERIRLLARVNGKGGEFLLGHDWVLAPGSTF